MVGRVGISSRGLDFGGGVDLSGKWLVLLEVVRMEKSGLEEGGCADSWYVDDGKGVRMVFGVVDFGGEGCFWRAKWDMRENA